MPLERVPKVLQPHQKRELLDILERIGSENLVKDLQSSLLNIINDTDLLSNKEFLLRYLLLAVVLDQQAESDSAREALKRIMQIYGANFFMSPQMYFDKIYEMLNVVLKVYKPRVRVIRMKSEGVTLLRIGGFLLAVHGISLKFGGLYQYFVQFRNPATLLEQGILSNPLLSALLFEKAARLYVGWITHPQLFVKLYGDNVRKSSIPMPVDGHVAKVFVRTGFLATVNIESKSTMIIEAEKERERIEKEVLALKPDADTFAIDYGTFLVGIKYCNDANPRCYECLLNKICNKNTMFKAY
jgi:endonuclease III